MKDETPGGCGRRLERVRVEVREGGEFDEVAQQAARQEYDTD